MRILALLFLIIAGPAIAQETSLIGTWKLASFENRIDNEPPIFQLGARATGYIIFTREGRVMMVLTGEGRKAGTGDAERAALHKTMFAYAGKYLVEGKNLIIAVDVSWNEAWNGTEIRRTFRMEGDKLFVETAPAPSFNFPGKTSVVTAIF
jgi:Lipocalin-like domain